MLVLYTFFGKTICWFYTRFLAKKYDGFVGESWLSFPVLIVDLPPPLSCFCLEQTDLVLEATHLDAFNANFASKAWDDCRFPRVIFRTEDVLVRIRVCMFWRYFFLVF